MTPITETPLTEVDQLKQQNALLLKRLLAVGRRCEESEQQRDDLAKQLALVSHERDEFEKMLSVRLRQELLAKMTP